MNLMFLKKAEEIAARGYQIQVEKEDEHDGPPIYVAYLPEIPECVAQGDSPEHARAELRIILVDVISYMLESDLDVPMPRTRKGSATVQVGDSQTTFTPRSIVHESPVSTGKPRYSARRACTAHILGGRVRFKSGSGNNEVILA